MKFSSKINTMLAPMEGVSHSLFRNMTASRGGVGVVCTEFIRISNSPVSRRALRKQVVKFPGVPLSVQVMGNHAEKMSESAQIVEEAGADIVDINLGCPMPRVVRKGVGAAMLQDLPLLYRVLSSMRKKVEGILSAKIRAGFHDKNHSLKIAKVVEDAGVDFIVIHPRSRSDFYNGVADWRIIREIKKEVNVPVIGNGDIWYAEDALRMEKETGCDGVMLGRPAIRNPWIFSQILSLKEGKSPFVPTGDHIFEHIENLRSSYEPHFRETKHGFMGPLKEHLRWIGRTVPDQRKYRTQVLRAQSIDEILRISAATFLEKPNTLFDVTAKSSLKLEQPGICSSKA